MGEVQDLQGGRARAHKQLPDATCFTRVEGTFFVIKAHSRETNLRLALSRPW